MQPQESAQVEQHGAIAAAGDADAGAGLRTAALLLRLASHGFAGVGHGEVPPLPASLFAGAVIGKGWAFYFCVDLRGTGVPSVRASAGSRRAGPYICRRGRHS